MEQQHQIHTISPVYNEHSRILILGSFPSVKSREAGFFYGHPQNRFWKVLANVFQAEVPGTIVAFTVLDVLGYLDEIPVCVGYDIDGEVTTDFPTTAKLKKAKPVYKVLPGWKQDIRGIKKYEDLPENCRKYIEFIEEQIGFPITMVSNGPKRSDIIYRGFNN